MGYSVGPAPGSSPESIQKWIDTHSIAIEYDGRKYFKTSMRKAIIGTLLSVFVSLSVLNIVAAMHGVVYSIPIFVWLPLFVIAVHRIFFENEQGQIKRNIGEIWFEYLPERLCTECGMDTMWSELKGIEINPPYWASRREITGLEIRRFCAYCDYAEFDGSKIAPPITPGVQVQNYKLVESTIVLPLSTGDVKIDYWQTSEDADTDQYLMPAWKRLPPDIDIASGDAGRRKREKHLSRKKI